jgi:hypothetical protein
MGTARNYHRMALECLELAEAARDATTQDTLIRMAELWASLADRAEARSPSRRPEARRNADAAA